jgi:hypothetical protein
LFNSTIELRKNINTLVAIYITIADWLNGDNIKTLEEALIIKKNIFQLKKQIEIIKNNNHNTQFLSDEEKKQIYFLLEECKNWNIDIIKDSIDDTILFLEEIESFSISNKTKKIYEEELKNIMWKEKYSTNIM